MVEKVLSTDGTTIAFERTGEGPSLILIGGAYNGRQSGLELSALLAGSFTAIAYDRRGRGDSTDNPSRVPQPDARSMVDRELEDLAALMEATSPDSPAYVYGHSSGAILALEAACHDLPIAKLVAYEPPYTEIAHDGHQTPALEWGHAIRTALDRGDREAATEMFMRGTGMDSAAIEFAKQASFWTSILKIADSVMYDLALVGDGAIPIDKLARISVRTLVLAGGNSSEWLREAAECCAAAVPPGRYRTLQGQTHEVSGEALAPVLIDYFMSDSVR